MVHTGPNIQFGGLKEGLFTVAYQESIEFVVKNEPRNPITNGINIEIAIVKIFFKSILFFIVGCTF